MSLVRTLRYQQQRHASFVRWAMLLVLLSVAAAGMPRWIMHAHATNHESTLIVAMDGHGLDAHDQHAGNPADPSLGGEHLHEHFIGASSSLLPPMFISIPGDALRAQRCPPGLVSSLCEGHLATLHRPPIV